MIKQILILLILSIPITFQAVGQDQNQSALPPIAPMLDDSDSIAPLSLRAVYLSLGVLAFGLVLSILSISVAFKRGWDQETTRIFAVSVIVPAGLFLIIAGYSDRQVAPMFGLMGTLVGYLLGKSRQPE